MATAKKPAARKPAAKKAADPKPQTPAEPMANLAEAARAEAAAGEQMNPDTPITQTITWRGLELSIPASAEEWDLDVAEAFEDGQIVRAMRGILGPAQWEDMKTKLAPKLKEINELAELISKVYGFESTGE